MAGGRSAFRPAIFSSRGSGRPPEGGRYSGRQATRFRECRS